jgi:hypothetical protein
LLYIAIGLKTFAISLGRGLPLCIPKGYKGSRGRGQDDLFT